MFGQSYFGPPYFGPHYFGDLAAGVAIEPDETGSSRKLPWELQEDENYEALWLAVLT